MASRPSAATGSSRSADLPVGQAERDEPEHVDLTARHAQRPQRRRTITDVPLPRRGTGAGFADHRRQRASGPLVAPPWRENASVSRSQGTGSPQPSRIAARAASNWAHGRARARPWGDEVRRAPPVHQPSAAARGLGARRRGRHRSSCRSCTREHATPTGVVRSASSACGGGCRDRRPRWCGSIAQRNRVRGTPTGPGRGADAWPIIAVGAGPQVAPTGARRRDEERACSRALARRGRRGRAGGGIGAQRDRLRAPAIGASSPARAWAPASHRWATGAVARPYRAAGVHAGLRRGGSAPVEGTEGEVGEADAP